MLTKRGLRSTIIRGPGSALAARPAWLLVRRAGRQQGDSRPCRSRSSRSEPLTCPGATTRCPRRPTCPGDAGRVRDIDGQLPHPRMSLPARGNRFRRLRNRPARLLPAAFARLLPAAVCRPPCPACRRRAQAAGEGRSRVRRLRDQFVSGQES